MSKSLLYYTQKGRKTVRHDLSEQFCKELILTYIKSGKIPDNNIIQETVEKAFRIYHVAVDTLQEANKERRELRNSKLRIY